MFNDGIEEEAGEEWFIIFTGCFYTPINVAQVGKAVLDFFFGILFRMGRKFILPSCSPIIISFNPSRLTSTIWGWEKYPISILKITCTNCVKPKSKINRKMHIIIEKNPTIKVELISCSLVNQETFLSSRLIPLK